MAYWILYNYTTPKNIWSNVMYIYRLEKNWIPACPLDKYCIALKFCFPWTRPHCSCGSIKDWYPHEGFSSLIPFSRGFSVLRGFAELPPPHCVIIVDAIWHVQLKNLIVFTACNVDSFFVHCMYSRYTVS